MTNHSVLKCITAAPVSTAQAALPYVNLAAQAAALTRVFSVIGNTRMQGVPVLHSGLIVETVGFEAYTDIDGALAALGILMTPWFMNLIWLPLQGQAAMPIGQVCERNFGGERFEFIGAHEASFGAYEMCSLFSPMFEFADQATAHATAQEVLGLLRKAPIAPAALASAPIPGRRAFLLGRVGPRIGEKA